MQEVVNIRAEVNDIWRRVALVKEAHALQKELEQIKQDLLKIQAQAKESASAEQAREIKEREEKKKKEREEQEKQEQERKENQERERKEKQERELKEKQERERKEQEEKAKSQSVPVVQKAATQPVKTAAQPAKAVSHPVKNAQPPTKTTAPTKNTVVTQSYINVPKNVPLDATDKYLEQKKHEEALERDAVFGAKTRAVEKPVFQQFGIDQEIQQTLKGKYDVNLEKEARDWIETVTGEKLEGNFAASLKSGVVLCHLINKIKPNTIKKVNMMKMPFMQMENIKFFLEAAKSLGVPEPDLFMTVDLFEEKNMTQVVQSIHSLGRTCQKVEGYKGPTIGAKLASKHETHFTEEQLKKGQTELNYSQRSQADTQNMVSEMRKPGLDSVIKTQNTGTTIAAVGLLDKGKSDAQKEANAARRVGHNIIK